MATLVTLNYDIDPGLKTPAAFGPQVTAVVWDQGELALLGMSLNAESTAVNGAFSRKQIVLNVLAQANAQFPTNALLIAATSNLFTQRFELQLASRVVAATPVVT